MRKRVPADAYPLRFRTSRGRAIHAGRVISWDGGALIEAACGGVQPPREGEEDRRSASTVVTCHSCACRIKGFRATPAAPQGAEGEG